MDIRELIEPDRVLDRLEARDKSQLLAEIARRAAEAAGLDSEVVLSALNAREQLGSTGVGHGVAVPHARIKGLARLLGLFARLARPVDFAAIDDQKSKFRKKRRRLSTVLGNSKRCRRESLSSKAK